ncbi:hypothetical protein ACSV5M_03045 [Cellvibrio sp. ARAG 10.3]|uniref:hypothetical protein n=1 Tax=Cellvibrio sp. ARAG 10.3 TaxID=3451358 RepID=UPI003F4837BA
MSADEDDKDEASLDADDEERLLEMATDETREDIDEDAGALEIAITDIDDDAVTDEEDAAEDTLAAAESSPDDDPPQPLNTAPTNIQTGIKR